MKKKILLFIFTLLIAFNVSSVFAKNTMEVKDLKIIDKSSTITVEEPTMNGEAITSKIEFNEVGDYVTYELTLKNNESERYKIDKITDSNEKDNVTFEYDYDDDFVEPGATTKVRIKVTYKKQVINVEKVEINDVVMTVDLVNETGAKTATTTTVLNPKTGDNVMHYIVLGFVAVAGLGLAIFGKKIKGSKVGMYMILSAVAMYPITALAADRFEIKISFKEIELKGKFEEYEIVVTDGDGNETTKQITYGQPMGELPEAPEKEGYAFVKYVNEDGEEVTSETIITKPITLEPVYRETVYAITFNPNGGTVNTESIRVNEGEKPTGLPTPNKEGFIFDGWYTALTGGTAVTTQTVINANVTVYARWIESDKLVNYTDADEDGYVSLGDVVKLGNDTFKVLEEDGSTIILLADYNLDSNARQLQGNTFATTFADRVYWTTCVMTKTGNGADYKACSINSNYSNHSESDNNYYVYGYNGNIKTTQYHTGTGANEQIVTVTSGTPNQYGIDENNISQYVSNYMNHLVNDLGIEGIKGARLLNYSEAYVLNRVEGESFWIGSANGEDMWAVTSEGNLSKVAYNAEYGIRPIIEIDSSVLFD